MNEDTSLELMAREPLGPADEAVLSSLAAIVQRADPMPAGLVDRVGIAMTLAELAADMTELSDRGALEPVMRSDIDGIQARTITFTTPVLTVMIMIQPVDAHVRLDGWVAPAGPLSVELRSGADLVETVCDEGGRFAFADVRHGHARLVVRPLETPDVPVVTPEIEL